MPRMAMISDSARARQHREELVDRLLLFVAELVAGQHLDVGEVVASASLHASRAASSCPGLDVTSTSVSCWSAPAPRSRHVPGR